MENRSLEQQQQQQQQAAEQHNLEQLSQRAAELFSQGVADWLLKVEELCQTISVYHPHHPPQASPNSSGKDTTSAAAAATVLLTAEQLLAWQYQSIDPLLFQWTNLERWCADASLEAARSAQTNRDLLAHCLARAVVVLEQLCQTIRDHYTEPTTSNNNNASGGSTSAVDQADYSHHSTENPEDDDGLDVASLRRDGQGAVARFTHVLLILQRLHSQYDCSSDTATTTTTTASIIARYVEYQRQVLRNRVKPAIAALVRERRQGTFDESSSSSSQKTSLQPPGTTTGLPAGGGAVVWIQPHPAIDNDDDDAAARMDPLLQQHHAPTLTVILGEAATLIHPLAAWRNAVVMESQQQQQDEEEEKQLIWQLCQDAIVTLDEQAQTLVRTVSDWFWQDRPVDQLLRQAAAAAALTSSNHNNNNNDPVLSLSRLDAMVQEMADVCRVLERYQHLVSAVRWSHDPGEEDRSKTNNTIAELLQEWTLKYGALERYLTLEQCRTACWQDATPVVLVVGTAIRVSSVVEDAYYLCERALQRAAKTRSASAVASVAYAVAHEVWSTEDPEETATTLSSFSCAVHQALVKQRGCWVVGSGTETASSASRKTKSKGDPDPTGHSPAPPSSSGFASALLEALDEDEGPSASSSSSTQSNIKSPKAPSSSSGSNFLTSILQDREVQEQREQDILCCILNSLQAASGAAQALVLLLEGLLSPPDDDDDENENNGCEGSGLTPDDQATRLIRQAVQDLSLYSDAYQTLLREQIFQAVQQWCGGPDADLDATGLHRGGCLSDLQRFWQMEDYQLEDGHQLQVAEADERLESLMLKPLRECQFLQQLRKKCEAHVWQVTAERLSTIAVELVLQSLWNNDKNHHSKKQFTEWGALLLSKQVRMLQNMISAALWQSSDQSAVAVPESTQPQLLWPIWERLWQVVTVLQLEKPSDWLLYHNPETAALTPDELGWTLSLRIDFDPAAIPRVVAKVSTTTMQPVHSNAQLDEQTAPPASTTTARET